MSAHRLSRDLAFNDYHVRRDPGSGKTLKADMSLVSYKIVTTGAEGRVLGTPERAMIVIAIVLGTDGGDLTVTTQGDETIEDGTTVGISATLDDANDTLVLMSTPYASGYRWTVLANVGCTLNAA